MNLFDTDTIIESLRDGRYEAGAISIISIVEILRGIDAKKKKQSQRATRRKLRHRKPRQQNHRNLLQPTPKPQERRRITPRRRPPRSSNSNIPQHEPKNKRPTFPKTKKARLKANTTRKVKLNPNYNHLLC